MLYLPCATELRRFLTVSSLSRPGTVIGLIPYFFRSPLSFLAIQIPWKELHLLAEYIQQGKLKCLIERAFHVHMMVGSYVLRKEIINPDFSHLTAKRSIVFGGHTFVNSLKY